MMTALGLMLVLGALEWRVVRRNVGVPWNGYGAIPGVLARNNPAPMRYRVLAAWLVGWLSEPARLVAYRGVKVALLGLALTAALPLVGPVGLLVLAVLVALTLQYDYWSGYAELLGVALCLSGDPLLVLGGALAWGLSRETVALAPALAFLSGGWLPALATVPGLLAWVLVHRVQGRAELYCERWALRAYNLPDLRRAWTRQELDPVLAVGWSAAVVGVVLFAPLPEPLAATRWVALTWVGAGWLWGRVREVRVMLPTALWLAGAGGWLG